MAALTAATLQALHLLPSSLISWDSIILLGVGIVLMFGLCMALGLVQTGSFTQRGIDPLRILLVIWWFLVFSEEVFARAGGTPEDRFEGRLSIAAYYEAALWILALLALLLVCLPRFRCVRGIFSGARKWVSLWGLYCILSAAYSPRPLLSMAWAFKLSLVIFLLHFCADSVRDLDDLRAFLGATFWAFACLAGAQIIRAFLNPASAFAEAGGRLGGSSVSDKASILFLLSLLPIFPQARARRFLFLILSPILLFLGGGKAAIAATLFSGLLFLVFQKKHRSAAGLLAGVSALGALVIAATPLSSYFSSYAESGQAFTLTGRTLLWSAVWPAISDRVVWGHGYMASTVLAAQVEGLPFGAAHTHNVFLEVLYNNGLIGLALFLGMSVVILTNLKSVISEGAERAGYPMAVGLLAIFVMLLVTGLANASIGGRPDSLFMLFLALVVLSEKLRGMNHGVRFVSS